MKKGLQYKDEESRKREQAHWFGQPNGNKPADPRMARSMRTFYDWCENIATLEELKEYAQDESKPATRRRFVQALMRCESVQDFFDLTNQTHGAPKQVVEVQELPQIDCKIFGDE